MTPQEIGLAVVAILTTVGGGYAAWKKIKAQENKDAIDHLGAIITRIEGEMEWRNQEFITLREDHEFTRLRGEFNDYSRGDCMAQVQLLRGIMVAEGKPVPEWKPPDWVTWYKERRRQLKEDSAHGDPQRDPRLRGHRLPPANPRMPHYPDPDGPSGPTQGSSD